MDPGTFLKALWGDNPPGQAHIWLNPPNTTRWYTQFDGINQDIEAHAGSNVYTGVALAPSGPRSPKERVLASHTTAIAGLWADIDYGTTGHKKTNLPPTLEDAIETLEDIRFPPTIVVNSGHGIQPWWLFDLPWAFASATDRALAQRLSRWWHQHIAEILTENGWALDATHDLSRVLRVPGTTNHKDEPVPVTVITADGPRRNRHEFVDLVPQDFLPVSTPSNPRQPLNPANPSSPQTQGTFLLNPNAEPPSIKLTTLLQFDKKFNRSWQAARPDLQDQSPSSYDLSLATIALDNGWTQQETVDLMIAWRRSHNQDLKLRQSYYRTTIDKALQPLHLKQAYNKLDEQLTQSQAAQSAQAAESPKPDQPDQPDQQDQPDLPDQPAPEGPPLDIPTGSKPSDETKHQFPPSATGGNPDLIDTLNVIMSITITKLTKFTGDPPVYWMSTTKGDITLGTVENLISQTKFRNAVAAATGSLIPTYKAEQWHKIGQTLLRACEEVGLGETSHPTLETNAWLESYLTDQPPTDDRNEAAVTRRPFTGPDCLYIYVDSFRRYIEKPVQHEAVFARYKPKTQALRWIPRHHHGPNRPQEDLTFLLENPQQLALKPTSTPPTEIPL